MSVSKKDPCDFYNCEYTIDIRHTTMHPSVLRLLVAGNKFPDMIKDGKMPNRIKVLGIRKIVVFQYKRQNIVYLENYIYGGRDENNLSYELEIRNK